MPAKKATKKKAAKKTTAKKASSKKAAAKKAPAKKTAKKAASKAAAKKAPAKKAASKKSTSKTPAKAKSPAKSKSTSKKTTKAATTATKAKPKTKFDKKFLDEQRALLHEEREKYEKSATHLKAEADSLVEGREPGDVQFDEESGDGDSLAVERDRGLHMSAQARQQVEEIDAALARIDDGTYGICSISGKSIPKERLRAIPWATERVEEKVGGFRR